MLPGSVKLVSSDIFITQKSRDLKKMKSPALAYFHLSRLPKSYLLKLVNSSFLDIKALNLLVTRPPDEVFTSACKISLKYMLARFSVQSPF